MKKKGRWKRQLAVTLAAITLGMTVVPYLPTDIVSWARDYFHLSFRNSGTAGHPDLYATVPGDSKSRAMFCLNEGASAHSDYLYYKTDKEVSYSEGSIEDKRMFWAYILTHGSADDNIRLSTYFRKPLEKNTMIGKRVAWSNGTSNGGSALIENYARDGFMSLENVPAGCKTPENIFELVSRYDTPEKAMWMGNVLSAPGMISGEKLYDLCGISDWSTFKQYCQITPVNVPDGMVVQLTYTDNDIIARLTDTAGAVVVGAPPITLEVRYDPNIFKVIEVTGTLEFYKCDKYGSQQLYRAKGDISITNPVFYMTTEYNPTTFPPPPSDGGGSGGDGGISYKTYRHQETFESNYRVDLKKYDYETGHPLKDSIWQVLESFPDQTELKQDETDGNLMERNMREAPTTWKNWLIFADSLHTDQDGYVSHHDKRYYDFGHIYCNGHPLPPEPEGGEGEGDEEEDDDEYEQLMEEWQAKVDECEAKAASSKGTFHHWLCGSESEPSESEAFEQSGCKAARDNAYENFINLRYSYTFRETDARDGYIIHGQNGHPDDVPVEIITTAASEAGKDYEWTQASNEDIVVEGYAREKTAGEDEGDEEDPDEEAAGYFITKSGLDEEDTYNLYLTERYELSMGQKTVNTLRRFFGLPEKFVTENSYTIKVVAEDHEILATASDAENEENEEEDGTAEIPLIDDITTATGSNALQSRSEKVATASNMSYHYTDDGVSHDYEARAAVAPILETGAYAAEDDGSSVLDSQPKVTEGPHDNTAHTFIVYDHRVPGQIHFNKRDLELKAGETDAYSAYGDTQGDAALEGAVYGLFAADDIYGPDTQRDGNGAVTAGTGVIFDANDLVAVATTDKNGDGSFLAITEKPHSIYNYKTGQIEYSGKAYPKNLYDADTYRKANPNEETGRIYKDCLGTNGDYWIGRPLILGNYYIKELSRSEGYELSITGKDLEVTNAAEDNRDDYGDSDDAKSHPIGTAWVSSQLTHAVTFPEGNAAYGNRENLFEFAIGSNGTIEGYNVVIDGIPAGADIYYNDVTTKPVKIQVPVGGQWVDATEAPLYETADSAAIYKKDVNGNPIPNPDAVKNIPVPYDGYARKINLLAEGGAASVTDAAKYNSAFTADQNNINYVKYELETMMRQLGMKTPNDAATGKYSTQNVPVYDLAGNSDYGSPEVTVEISNVTTNGSVIEALLDYYTGEKIFTYGSLQKLEKNGNTVNATVAVGATPNNTFLYETDESGSVVAAYLYKLNKDTNRYVMRKYTTPNLSVIQELSDTRCRIQVAPDYTIGADGMPVDILTCESPLDEYLHYEIGDTLYEYWSADGSTGYNPVRRRVYETIFEEQESTEETIETSKVAMVASKEDVIDPVSSTYAYYDALSGQYTLHVGTADAALDGAKTSNFTIAIPNGSTTVTAADIEKIGSNNVWEIKEGDSLHNSEYIRRISGAGVGVYAGTAFDQDKTYIRNQNLIYNGNHDLREDGGTDESPAPVLERIISQKIKVTKMVDERSYNNTSSYAEVHEDWWTRLFGGSAGKDAAARKVPGFRFKTYLKSNLERLYRDEEGNVIWQDRKGNEIDILAENRAYPALAGKIYTKVLHETAPLYQDSQDAVVANTELYSYTDGYLNENQNPGYTAVLETAERLAEDGTGTRIVKSYNYDKFFGALRVANNDKWDDAAPTYTSWQPIGNAANRTEAAIQNAKASDMVRQFAIDWYLDDEVAKLVREVPTNPDETEDKDGSVPYTDEMYDEALQNAIAKAENYLKPFFAYDLDEIYAVAWDGEADGGNDHDAATLSVDSLYGDTSDAGEGYYFGISAYLPYGTYVIAEQQPRYADLEDFKNKHYEIDKPREVEVPSAYVSYDGSQTSPEKMNGYYHYDVGITQPEMERKYKIRFHEEPVEAGHLIKSRNTEGDFEVYKYGLTIDQIENGAASAGAGAYYALTQDAFKPDKNHYNAQDDRTTGDVPYYLTEGLSGREKVSKYYRYSAVAEKSGTADDVPYPGGTATEDNVPGIQYKDHVPTMHGVQTAYDGKYASMLVPWSMVSPENAATEPNEVTPQATGESSYKGYGYTKFRNRLYTAKLRIEKLDSDTHENILHDGALFNIYAAKRDDSPDGEGRVLFYDTDTTITGTKEFLEAMGATHIQPVARRAGWVDRLTGKEYGPGNLYSGIVPAGTPVCEEEEQIILGDSFGTQTVAFKSYSTVLDGEMKEEVSNAGLNWQFQTVGYLETPQPLSAGCYVICEAKSPTGYARSKPVALEIYSDRVTYYKEGQKDSRVLAALYEYESDNQTVNGTKPQDRLNVARINVENAPIKLKVEKLKESSVGSANTTADKTVTYKVGGRIDGKLAEIGNNPDYVYAYENGEYLGYAWKKGTLEYLAARKAAGEQVEIVYNGRNFSGYGYVTRTMETADDANQYVAGATMTLFDALALNPSGDTEDHAYEGLVIERSDTNNITRMYVKEGYAGEKVEFVKEKDEAGQEITVSYQAGVDKNGDPVMAEGNIWSAVTIERPDTDILYYDLDSLAVTETETVDGREILYGYDRNYNKVPIEQVEADKNNVNKTDAEHSVFAFKGGTPYLEFTGGDFTKINYSAKDKILTVDEDTLVYHLDRDGNRDALVDPYTGMAYVTEQTPEGKTQVLVWAVNIHRDEHGNIIARDKITTSRIATVGENQDGYQEEDVLDVTNNSRHEIPEEECPSYSHSESGYITGTWKSEHGEESHKETSVNTNESGQNMNEEVLTDDNNGSFRKQLNPVYDSHGLAQYYQRSDETYDKSTDLYDRNGDFVRQQDSDNLEEYNGAAYRINNHEELYDGDEKEEAQARGALYHRLGEGYILENTWTTSDKTPNDPFDDVRTDGQPDILKRLPAGRYIMEELESPNGYLKGMPTGISVEETANMQHVGMVDKTTKEEIDKIDGAENMEHQIIDRTGMDKSRKPKVIGTERVGMGSYSYGSVSGAQIALFEAEKVYTADTETYPKGYYLKKIGTQPVEYASTEDTASAPRKLTAKWTTGTQPIYLEGIPQGAYLLEELHTPEGFVTSAPVEVEITNTPEVQSIVMYDDHTRIEVEKYTVEGTQDVLLSGAGFTLYEAKTDSAGNIVYEDGKPQYYEQKAVDSWETRDGTVYSGFIPAFEEMYKQYGTQPGTSVSWTGKDGAERRAVYTSCEQLDPSVGGGFAGVFPTKAAMIFTTDEGSDIRVSIYGQQDNRGGRDFTFEYQFDYRKLPGVNAYANSYLTLEGRHRIEYLPAGGKYVLVETKVPEGFAKAEDTALEVLDTADIQRYRVENIEGTLIVSKTAQNRAGELSGAHLGLYRADSSGAFVPEPEYLEHDWITGSDGTYTELDYINNRIPDGYAQGDLKPHYITKLATGTYWLAEIESPNYYTTFEPVKIDYRQEDEIRIIRVSNVPADGELEVKKTGKEGNVLPGATYELSAYRKSDLRTPVFTRAISSATGITRVTGLPVGEVQADGSIIPYLYKLKEKIPPDGYAANTQIFKWEFAPDKDGVSFAFGEAAEENVTVVDEKTRIVIGKKDFDALGDDNSESAFVAGADLAVYEITGRDAEDNLIYDKEHPVEAWVTQGSETAHVLEGLIAGRSYLLMERKAPQGYNTMKPVIFTISTDGRKIAAISNKMNTITVNHITAGDMTGTDNVDLDSIQSVTLKGRYAVKVANELTAQDGSLAASWVAGEGEDDYVIYKTDGIEEGVYTITERTLYSDGTEAVTARQTRSIRFGEDGTCKIPCRGVKGVELSMQFADGTEIVTFEPTELIPEKTVKNNVSPENPVITMRNRNTEPGSGLNPAEAVFNAVTVVNTSNVTCSMEVAVQTDAETNVIDAGTGKADGDKILFTAEDVKPLESRKFTFTTEVGGYSSAVTATVKYNGKGIVATKEAPVLQPGQLTVYNELTGSGRTLYDDETSEFTVHLYAENGEELKGSYAYTGSRAGSLKSGDTVTLAGNEYITINPDIYRNAKYKVNRKEDGKEIRSWNTDGIIGAEGSCATYTRSLPDTSDRELFKKGGSYILTETTTYSDGSALESSRMQVELGDNVSIEHIIAMDKRTEVSLSKVEITGEKELPGCEMELAEIQDGEETLLDTWVSGMEPHIIKGVLQPGREYILRERRPADGYAYADEIRFTVNANGVTDVVIMEDKPTHIVVSKKSITGEDELPGNDMAVFDKDGNLVDAWISGDQPHEIVGKLTAGETYILRERRPADGFAYAEEIEFTVSMDGSIDHVTMRDKETEVEVQKLATGSNAEPLDGAVLQILNEDKTPVTASNATEQFAKGDELIFRAGADFTKIVRQLVAGRKYWLHEVTPKPGYAFADDVPFTVSLDGSKDVVVMFDKPTHVIVSKTDITGEKELPGNDIAIFDKNGNLIESWISGDRPHEIVGKLIAGETYILRERRPADGFAYAEEIEFTVSLDGSIDHVEMKNDETRLEILKVDAGTGKPLAKAEFQILDADGTVYDEWTSTTEVHVISGKLAADQVYYLHEKQAPTGYLKAADMEFTVPHGAETLVLTFKNRKLGGGGGDDTPEYITFKKVGPENEAVAGAKYEFYYSDGSLYAEAVSDENGTIKIPLPSDGTYTYRETEAPSPYLVNPEIYSFTVSNGIVTRAVKTLVDRKAPEIDIQKLDGSNHEPLAGAVIEIWNDTGYRATGTTTEDGLIRFDVPAVGVYHIREKVQPEGYQLHDKPYDLVVKDDGTVTGSTTIFNSIKPMRIGKVYASYNSRLNGKGFSGFGELGVRIPGLPHTGQPGDSTWLIWSLIFLTSASALAWMLIMGRRKKYDRKN